MDKLISKYKLFTDDYDVIIGYRADDKYFSYAEQFIRASLYKESLDRALRLGNLGLQVFIKSKKAFERLQNAKHSCELVDKKYLDFYMKRDTTAREQFNKIMYENKKVKNKVTIFDV